MSLTKLSLGWNNDVIYKLYPPRESLVSESRLGTGISKSFFYGVLVFGTRYFCRAIGIFETRLCVFKFFSRYSVLFGRTVNNKEGKYHLVLARGTVRVYQRRASQIFMLKANNPTPTLSNCGEKKQANIFLPKTILLLHCKN
jgi:hypothetical protein